METRAEAAMIAVKVCILSGWDEMRPKFESDWTYERAMKDGMLSRMIVMKMWKEIQNNCLPVLYRVSSGHIGLPKVDIPHNADGTENIFEKLTPIPDKRLELGERVWR